MDREADDLTEEQKHVGEVLGAMPRCMVLGITPEHVHTLQAAAKHPRIFQDLVQPILDGILSLPQRAPLRTAEAISKCKDPSDMAATVLLWLASHEGQVSDMGKATGDFLREFTTNLLNWRRELMKASTTGRTYTGAWAPDIATIAMPEVEVEGVGGVQGLVAQAQVPTGPASPAPAEERLVPLLAPRAAIETASAGVKQAARAAFDAHFATPLPQQSGGAKPADDADEGLDGIDEADEAEASDDAEEGDSAEGADGADAAAIDSESCPEASEAADRDGAVTTGAAEPNAEPGIAAAGGQPASASPWLRAALSGIEADKQPASATADSTAEGSPAPEEAPAASEAPVEPATPGKPCIVVDTAADSASVPRSEPSSSGDSSTSAGSGSSIASHASPSAAAAAAASPQAGSPSSAPTTPQLLSPQRTVLTTPRSAARVKRQEGQARTLRRAVSFSEKAISHANHAETRALYRQLSRLFDDGASSDEEDDCDAELRSASLASVQSTWRKGGAKLSAIPTAAAGAASAEDPEVYSPIELSIEVYKAMVLDARAFGASFSAVAQLCDAVSDCVCNYGKSSLAVGLSQLIVKKARVMLAQFWTLRKSATLSMSSTMEVRSRRRVLRDRKEFASTVTHTLEGSLDELRASVASYEAGKRELVRREAALKGWELETRALLVEAKNDFEAQIAESTRLVAGLREKLDAALKEVREEQRKVVVAQQCKPTLDWYRSRAEQLEKELAASKLRVASLEHELSTQ